MEIQRDIDLRKLIAKKKIPKVLSKGISLLFQGELLNITLFRASDGLDRFFSP